MKYWYPVYLLVLISTVVLVLWLSIEMSCCKQGINVSPIYKYSTIVQLKSSSFCCSDDQTVGFVDYDYVTVI